MNRYFKHLIAAQKEIKRIIDFLEKDKKRVNLDLAKEDREI